MKNQLSEFRFVTEGEILDKVMGDDDLIIEYGSDKLMTDDADEDALLILMEHHMEYMMEHKRSAELAGDVTEFMVRRHYQTIVMMEEAETESRKAERAERMCIYG